MLAGSFLDAGSAAALGLLTHLVEPADVQATVTAILELGKPGDKYPGRPVDESHPTSAFATAFYSDGNMATLMSGGVPEGFDGEDKTVSRQLKSLSRAAPIALTMASALLDDATTTGDDIDTGLALELERLAEIFGTADALEGLSALIEGRRPSYTAA